MNHDTLLLIFVGLTAFALLVQAIVVLVFFVSVRKVISAVQADVQELRTGMVPVLAKSRDLLDKVGPRVESIAVDVAQLARTMREQGIELQATASDVLERVNRQTTRLDAMFTHVVDGMEHATNVVADSVSRPARQVSAMMASARAFLAVLTAGKREAREDRVATDQDMFV